MRMRPMGKGRDPHEVFPVVYYPVYVRETYSSCV